MDAKTIAGKPHVDYIDHDSERDAITAAKAAEEDAAKQSEFDELRQPELAKILAYLGEKRSIGEDGHEVNDECFPSAEEENKLFHVRLVFKTLEAAVNEKEKEKALKASGVEDAEREEITFRPASLYYPYLTPERNPASKGLNPFLWLSRNPQLRWHRRRERRRPRSLQIKRQQRPHEGEREIQLYST